MGEGGGAGLGGMGPGGWGGVHAGGVMCDLGFRIRVARFRV